MLHSTGASFCLQVSSGARRRSSPLGPAHARITVAPSAFCTRATATVVSVPTMIALRSNPEPDLNQFLSGLLGNDIPLASSPRCRVDPAPALRADEAFWTKGLREDGFRRPS